MSTFGADVREQQVGINLGSDFQDGVFTPSEELNGEIRELHASLARSAVLGRSLLSRLDVSARGVSGFGAQCHRRLGAAGSFRS